MNEPNVTSKTSHLRAVGYAITGFSIYVVADVCMKIAGEAGLPPHEIIGFLGFFGVVLLLARASLRHDIKTLWPKSPRRQLVRALLGLFIVYCNVVALKHMSLTMFYITVFMAPMVTALLAAFFLKENLKAFKILAICAGFAGVVIAIDPARNILHGDWIGYAMASAGTFAFAINMTWLRVITQTEKTASLAFFNAAVTALVGFALTVFQMKPVSGHLLVILFLLGLTGVAGDLVIYKAFKHTTAANVAQFHYTQLVTGALFGYFLWGDKPTWQLLAGIVLIVGSGLYIAADARKADKTTLSY